MDGEGGVTREEDSQLCFQFSKSNRGMVRFNFFFSVSVQISHELLFVRGHPLQTGGDCVPWCRAALVTTKGTWGSAGKDQGHVGWRPGGPRVQWVAPERTQVARGDAKEDQGRVGRHPEGPRADWLAPGRMTTVVVVNGGNSNSHCLN